MVGQGDKCINEEERKKRYLAAHQRYNTKIYYCKECNKKILLCNKARHKSTRKHIRNMNNK